MKNFLNHVRLVDELMIRISPLAFWTSEGIEAELVDETLNFSKTLGDFKPSMLQDLEARKPPEYEAFNGIVVKLLRQAGDDAPVNQVFYGTLEYLDKKFARRRQVKS